MDSLIMRDNEREEEDELKKQIMLSKRTSLDTIGLSKNKKHEGESIKQISLSEEKKPNNDINNDLIPSLYGIKEEYVEENNEKDKDKDKENNKNEIEMEIESKKGTTINKKVREMRRIKTDGNLPSFGGDAKGAEERRNRLAKRLNKAKEVNKKREEENKYRKSIDISMKAKFLENKMNEKEEDKKE